MFPIYYFEMSSPVGTLLLVTAPTGLITVHFQSGPKPMTVASAWIMDPEPLASVMQQLNEYFAGERRCFNVSLAPQGTPFQRSVWAALRTIPYGAVRSYGDIARQVDRPHAYRAVGRANGANPWPIVVPCHRVIGSDQSLTGFGGGLDVKRSLLRLEAKYEPLPAEEKPAAASGNHDRGLRT